MKLYTAQLRVNSKFFEKLKPDEAIVLSHICELSSQLRTFCLLFEIPHPASRMGWIVEGTRKLKESTGFDEKKISTVVKRFVKDGLVDQTGKAYRPNAENIEKYFSGSGYNIQNVNDSVETPTEWDKLSRQEFWDAIPGVSDGLPKITLDEYVKRTENQSEWAKQYKILDNAPAHIVEASFTCYQITGFIPDNKDWIAAIALLVGIAQNNHETLKEGLLKGNSLRSQGVAMTSLRSYQGCVREIAASKRVVVGQSTVKKEVIRI